MILAALAAGAGIARGVSGIMNAGKNARADRDLIKRAYQISKKKLNLQQGDIRQNTTESLNARGVLSGGDNVTASPEVTAAMAPAAAAGKGFLGKAKGIQQAKEAYESQRMAGDATRGQTGQGNTLAGGVEGDLSKEFLLEQQDLWQNRQQGIQQTKRQQSADTAGAIASGIDVASQVYSGGQMLKSAYGAAPTTAAIPSASPASPIKPGLWFGGYDPTDPLGLGKKGVSNTQFNVVGNK